MEGSEAGRSPAQRRPVAYCIVPRDLADQLHEPLSRHFAGDPSVEVVVERRETDRRRTGERRVATPEDVRRDERRRIRAPAGRRVAEQRAGVVNVRSAPLPRKARPHAARIVFVERLEPVGLHAEDADTNRLITRIQAGDAQAFTVLYERYFARIYAYMRVVFREPHGAEDATQDVFLRVFEALPGYELRSQPFRGWLFVVARNHALNEVRQLSRSHPLDSDEIRDRRLEERSDEDLHALDWISDRELHLFIERLPMAQRQVLFLRYVFGFTTRETAEIVGLSIDNVRKQHSRALTFLRRRLTSLGRTPTRFERRGAEVVLRKSTVLRRRRFGLIAPR